MEACVNREGTSIEVPLDSGENRGRGGGGAILTLFTSISELVHPSMASVATMYFFPFPPNRSHGNTFCSCYFSIPVYFGNILANKMAEIRRLGNRSP
jgi:hypothetical protein